MMCGKIKTLLMKFYFFVFPSVSCCKKANFARREWLCYKYLRRHIDWADSSWKEVDQETPQSNKIAINKTIFVYWKQGFENAPSLVKKCLESVKRNAGDYNVLCLTGKNIKDYVAIPQHVVEKYEKGFIGEAHFSDIIRANLIYRYGGIWCDATCFFSGPIESYVENADFFVFQKSKLNNISALKCSNWFIKGKKGNNLLRLVVNYLYTYYLHFDGVIHYFLFHLVLSLVVNEKKEIAKEWNKIPYVCNMNPHVFLFSLEKEYAYKEYWHILQSCFVHKLTYKFPQSLLDADKENMLQHFLMGDENEKI